MDRLNYHHLYIFWVLAKEGTFTKCAEKLLISQSAVTAQIQHLENILGMNLIDRTNRRKPVLTEEGLLVIGYADSIFETGAELLKFAKHGTEGKNQIIKIGALSGLSRNFQFEFIKPLMKKADIKLQMVTGDQEKLVKLLKEHSLDLILSSHNVRSDGRIHFYSHVLTQSPLVFVRAGKKNKAIDFKDCLKKNALYLPSQSFEARPEIDAYLLRLKFDGHIAGEIDDIALLRLLAINSGAIVTIPEMGVINEIKSKQLHILAKPTGLFQKFYAITRQKKLPNKIAESLIETIRENNK